MAQVISFEQYRPVARYDATAWTQVRIEESDSSRPLGRLGVDGTGDAGAVAR